MAKKDFAFGRENFILIVITLVGFVTMIFGILRNSKNKKVTE